MPTSRLRIRGWVFTSFEPTFCDDLIVSLSQLYEGGARYVVAQLELAPTTERLHAQGYIYFKNPKTLVGVKKAFAELDAAVHLEPQRASHEQAIAYCQKEDTRVPDTKPVEFGEQPDPGRRTDLDAITTDILDNRLTPKEVALTYPSTYIRYHNGLTKLCAFAAEPYSHDSVRGIWITGSPGVGKSYTVRQKWPDLYLKSQNKWFDGYSGQSVILIDDFDKGGACLYHYMKIWADSYACTGEIKGGTVDLQHKRFVVTSNYSISDIFSPDEDSELYEAISRRFVSLTFTRHFRSLDQFSD